MEEHQSLLGSKANPHLANLELGGNPILNWFKQLKILLIKNFLLIKSDWSWTIVLSPILIVALLFILQIVLKPSTLTDPNPKISPLKSLENCSDAKQFDENCITIAWAVGNPTINSSVAFDFQNVMTIVEQNTRVRVQGFPSEEALVEERLRAPRKMRTGVVFNPVNDTTASAGITYKIYNQIDSDVYKLQHAVDTALFASKLGASFELPIMFRKYPTVYVNLNQPTDATSELGPLFFFLPPMILTFIALYKIVQEKEKLLRLGMNVMGLKDSAFWSSWLVTTEIFNLLMALVLIFAGMAFQFPFFLKTSFMVNLVVFFEFGTAMISMGFFLSTVLDRTTAAANAGWAVLIVGFGLQLILFRTPFIVYAFYSDIWWLQMIRYPLQILYPPFNFSKAFIDISQKTQPYYDKEKGKYVDGKGFSWSDLYEKPKSDFLTSVNIPSTNEVLWYMFAQILFYFLLSWYFDNIRTSPNGPGKPLWFFLRPGYWGFHSMSSEANVPPPNTSSEIDADVQREATQTLNADPNDPRIAMRILGLHKIYQSNPFYVSEKDQRAVNGLYLTINNGECFCFLGHNGAGKTTTINMLNGLYEPTLGTAKVYGLDIQRDITALRKVMGVCPQHDILWPELTARQHLRLFAEFKGIPRSQIEQAIEEKLREVNLDDVGDNPSRSFSGGMKRRLSVAIASIGNPKVIFLDEPTTGLDPLSKRAVWDLIQNLKKDRCVILTTHSLEEADVLSDRIAIMSFGQFRCLGTALHLKNRYGDGYRMSIMCPPEEIINVKEFVAKHLQETEILDESAGSVTFKISLDRIKELSNLCQQIEEKAGPPITDWGISHTTLEDVFIRVTQESNFNFKKPKPSLTPNFHSHSSLIGSLDLPPQNK